MPPQALLVEVLRERLRREDCGRGVVVTAWRRQAVVAVVRGCLPAARDGLLRARR
jgi:hypothetical protein